MFRWIYLVCLVPVHAGIIPSSVQNENRSVCESTECREFAAGIIANMNSSVEPCENFYEYACGNWPERNPIPPGNNVWKFLTITGQKNKDKVADLLNQELIGDEISSVRKAKRFYKACIDLDNREKRGLGPVVSILSAIGGWPLIMGTGEWNEQKYKWQKVDDYYARLKGTNLFHEIRVASYGKNSTGLSAVLDVPDLPAATWLLNSEVVEDESSEEQSEVNINKNGKYWRFVKTVIIDLAKESQSVNNSTAELEKDIEDLLRFQWKLDKFTYALDEYQNMTIRDFQKWYNDLQPNTENAKVNWTRKIVNIFRDARIDVDAETNLKVVSPDYFKQLSELLDNTPSHVIVNYLHWNFVSNTISKTTAEMRKLYEETTEAVIDSEDTSEEIEKEEINQSELCIEESKMNDVIAYEYIRKYFSNETLFMALHAIDDIQQEIEIQIRRSDWADEEIKNRALRKLRTLKKNVGYPSWYRNITLMTHLLDGLSVGSTYFENSLNLGKFYKLKDLRLLKYEEIAKPWIVDTLTINAFYLSKSNSITVPMANLQQPFFSRAQPNTINYGLTGYLLAHEMNHAYDQIRHIYNEHGEEIAWPVDMEVQYNKTVPCFVNQMDNYTLDGTPSGPKIRGYGNQTLDENMCDTMGLQAVYKAYKRREDVSGKLEDALPGLEMFSNDQIFFLSFANLFCESIKPEFITTVPKFDIHAIGRLRVTSSLSNNEDFARTFNCPAGSPMNPLKKCSIWKHSEGGQRWTSSYDYRVYQL